MTEENKKDKKEIKTEEKAGIESTEELEECKKKCEEYLAGWKRERADFINYKKEEIEKMGELIKYANEGLILKLLPILDNIYLAEKELPESLDTAQDSSGQIFQAWKIWTEGFLQIKKQLCDFMQKQGIEEIKTVGEKFDPNFMEIAEEVESGASEKNKEFIESGTVIEEIQKGYALRGKVIRPAKVKISK